MGTLNNTTTVKKDGEIIRKLGQKNTLNTEAREKEVFFLFSAINQTTMQYFTRREFRIWEANPICCIRALYKGKSFLNSQEI